MVVYSTGCPKCKVLKRKLDDAKIKYDLVEDVDEVVNFCQSRGISSAPVLYDDVNDKIYDFVAANNYIKESLCK